jgi:hypothetical protein
LAFDREGFFLKRMLHVRSTEEKHQPTGSDLVDVHTSTPQAFSA